MTHLKKIQQFSTVLEKILLAALVIIPLADAVFWFFLFGNESIILPSMPVPVSGGGADAGVCFGRMPISELSEGVQIQEGVITEGMVKEGMPPCFGSVPFPLPTLNLWLGYIVNWLPLAVQLFAIWWLRKLFKNYAQGKVFTVENVRCYRILSYCLLVWFLILPVHELLFSLALTAGQEPVMIGFGMVGFGFSSANFLALLVGFALLIMSYVMEAAHKLEQESRMTI